jgi:hypothetical protein
MFLLNFSKNYLSGQLCFYDDHNVKGCIIFIKLGATTDELSLKIYSVRKYQ